MPQPRPTGAGIYAQPAAARRSTRPRPCCRAIGYQRYLAEVLCGRGALALAEGDRPHARCSRKGRDLDKSRAGPDSQLGRAVAGWHALVSALALPGTVL